MYQYDQLSLLYPALNISGDLKTENKDFIVDELMPVNMSGNGEHSWLNITKKNSNTDFVATQLAKFAGVAAAAVSYAGLKDRNALTTQWFSVHLPGIAEPQWSELISDDFKINTVIRHNRKLKRGTLSGNRFEIRLRQLQGEESDWQQRLQQIARDGVPNYFGKQRFGHNMNNLKRAFDLVETNKIRRLKPPKRSIYYSAMRSWIFNEILSGRIHDKTFTQACSGDVMMLADSHACFAEAISPEIEARLAKHEIHLTAALWGKGATMAADEIASREQGVAEQHRAFAESLEKAGMKQERRAMRLMPVNMKWQFEADNSLIVSFELTKGSYATAVLRELGAIQDKSLPEFK
ncbi:MAG: tRNA pseudouridine(13) synthase TruD [Gammaproteobacteria bacterium]|nr:tRNA pseudouridine(13) synthase TruD [Gammaproteobacteria bacterium]